MKRVRSWLAGAVFVGVGACFPDYGTCVARGSRVRTPRGLRNIEDLAIGDEVLCLDPGTGAFATGRLIATRSAKRECVRLSYPGGSLTLTSDHPTYSPEDAQWAPAGDWALGKRTALLVATDEEFRRVEVTEVTTFAGVFEVFDLTVHHPLHNFIAEGVLVHNKSLEGEQCLLPDGGMSEQFEYDWCLCPGGDDGVVQCVHAGAICASCPDVDDLDGGKADGGTGDGG